VLARDIAPPRTALIIKRYLASLEDIDEFLLADLYLNYGQDDEEPVKDDARVPITLEHGPGATREAPLAIVLRELQPIINIIVSDSLPSPSTSSAPPPSSTSSPPSPAITFASAGPRSPLSASLLSWPLERADSLPPMSPTEPGKVAFDEKPPGWATAHLTCKTELHTVSSDGQFKRSGKSFDPRTLLYVDKSSLTNRTNLSDPRWNTYRVVVPKTRDIGFMFPERVMFD